jgi:hypothetical protein
MARQEVLSSSLNGEFLAGLLGVVLSRYHPFQRNLLVLKKLFLEFQKQVPEPSAVANAYATLHQSCVGINLALAEAFAKWHSRVYTRRQSRKPSQLCHRPAFYPSDPFLGLIVITARALSSSEATLSTPKSEALSQQPLRASRARMNARGKNYSARNAKRKPLSGVSTSSRKRSSNG